MSRRAPRSRNALTIARFLTVFVAVTAVVAGTVAPVAVATASASQSTSVLARNAGDPTQTGIVKTSLAGFNPGNIMSDAVFTNKSTMTEAQIQTFFNSKVAKCQSGYTCLRNFKINSVTRPADAYCSGYKGAANETAARIIYRVAQACGINPQVLIVMLQKEQGLITHTWPSAWRYDSALGQGCPDTAPCDPNFVGFFHQIYGAARQMQIYMEGKWFQWYAPGKTWNLLYHPNRGCGTSPVYIANKATAALYYYTPYQPNAAALRAGYGEGNSCSSYGNRNFYNYFTDWFGPTATAVTGAIATEWARLGGANGTLGQPQMNASWVPANGGGYYQRFTGGYIWLKSGAGVAYGMGNGPFLANYKAAGAERGTWGWPASRATCALVLGGCKMTFQTGTTFYSPATQSVLVPQAMVSAYTKLGGEGSSLGYPSKAATVGAGSKIEQQFVGATAAFSPATGIVQLAPALADAWRSLGGVNSSLGMPKAAPVTLAANGSGKVLELTAGTIWESSAGAFAMGYGPFRTNYLAARGPEGAWGWPTSGATCGLTGGGCYMSFQNGVVGYSTATGSVLMTPAVSREWLRVDPRSIGYPKAAAQAVSGGGVQEFTAGSIYSSSAGSFAMGYGPLRNDYLKAGGPTGAWGWPTSGANCVLAQMGCTLSFQKGLVAYTAPTGSMLIPAGAILDEWNRLGGVNSSLGYPTATAAVSGTVTTQKFQNGSVSYDSATKKVTVS